MRQRSGSERRAPAAEMSFVSFADALPLEDCGDPAVEGAARAVRRGRDADARAIANFINLVEKVEAVKTQL